MKYRKNSFYARYIKRILDVAISAACMLLLSPIYMILAVLVRWKLGSPVIFCQDRPGLEGKLFQMYKFRTMLSPQTRDGKILTDSERLECIKNGIDVLSDEERLITLGKWLRILSLDELPELWNIFRGDMSIVGPRPLATIYLPYYTEEENRRHEVRPGLTGLAQVNGRNSASWETKFKYDVEYVDHISFLNDIRIILKTVAVVFLHKDIGQGEERPESFSVVRQRQWDEMKKKEKMEHV